MYIALEGIDGVGKTTHIQHLKQWLETKKYTVETITEPTNTEIGKLIRKQLTTPNITTTKQEILALLFAADRLTQKKKINNNKKKSTEKIIISDRSFYSSIAYQHNNAIKKEWIHLINMYMPRPDLTVILDIDPEEAFRRCSSDDTFEDIDFLRRTCSNYRALFGYPGIVVVDAMASLGVVQERLRGVVGGVLGV